MPLQYIYELVLLMNHETIVYYVPRTTDKHMTQFFPIKLNDLLLTIRCSLSWKSVEDAYQARSLKPLLDAGCLTPIALSRTPQFTLKALPRTTPNTAASDYSPSWSIFSL